nr:beta-galactosidase [Armatimonadota bacterium]
MNISRRSFIAGTTGMLSAFSTLELLKLAEAAGEGASTDTTVVLPPAKLRGYGLLSARHRSLHDGQSSVTHITCESPAKAHLVQAKYLSDLTRLPGTHDDTFTLSGHPVPIRRTALGGAVACYARGSDVLIFAAASDSQLQEIGAAFAPHSLTSGDFLGRVPVPMYLDRWDKYGLLIYYGPFTAPPDVPWPEDAYDYGGDVTFVRDNETGLVIWDKICQWDTAEGMANMQWWGWIQEAARRMGVPMHLNSTNDWPTLWLSNRYRDETQLRMPQFLGGFYDVGWQSGSQAPISWNSQAGEDALLGAIQQTVKRYAGDPNIVGWLEPHGETGQLPQSLFCEYGPVADQSFRQYLRERFGKLSTLSQRWTGGPGHYKTWDDVRVPEIAEFAGFGPQAIDLQGTWRVKYVTGPDGKPSATAPTPTDWYGTGFDDSGWDEFVAPGNDRMMSMGRTPLVYRRMVDVPAAWLAAAPQVTLYVWEMSDQAATELAVYINGVKVTGQARGGGWHRWMVLDATKALRAGPNLFVINAPKAAICYRIYLTTDPSKQYPELGPHKNAQWADFNSWTLWSREAQLRRGVEMIRQVDPNSSINFMAPNDDVGPITGICKDYGCRFHDTGGMAGFWTDEDSIMMSGARLPVTAEPGNGAPNVAEFQKFWGRWLTEGVNGVHYFMHLGEILWNPPVLAEFKKNRQLYEAIGKYHVPFAEVGILFSTRNHRLTTYPWDPNFTDLWQQSGYYTGLNPAGALIGYCPRDGISEEDLNASLVERFRVVTDTNTSFMDEATIAGIEAYVRAGGVFITNGLTGRHTEIEPDAWPISKLTGYAVINAKFGGTVALSPGQTVFTAPEWNGFNAGGLSLKKVVADAQDLLRWQDGSVALGMRPLGRGWIVHVGPTGNMERTRQLLLTHFGVRSRVPATIDYKQGLHFRHYIGNTGLQDVWVIFNEIDTPATTTLTFLPGIHLQALADIVTGDAISITRDPAGDSVPNIALAGHQTVMYVSPRSDIAASPLEWLHLQRGWWQGTKTPPAKHLPTPAEQQRFTLDLTQN